LRAATALRSASIPRMHCGKKFAGARAAISIALLAACGSDADQGPELDDASSAAVTLDASAAAPPDAGSAPTPEASTADASLVPEGGLASDARAAEAGGATTADASTGLARDAASDASPTGDASPSGDADASCPFAGQISYTLARAAMPNADQNSAYALITAAMDAAIAKYNCYTDITRSVRVSYDPGVATADGNVNGAIRFGARASMLMVTAMHELSHVLGVGSNEFRAKVQSNLFNGARATAQLREITGKPDDVVHSDGTHFWPNGLNYPNEYKAEADAVNHCKMVVAIRADLGL
jgi:hypothetical protein